MKKMKMRKLISLLLLLAMLAGDFLMPAARSVLASDGAVATAAPPAGTDESLPDASGEPVVGPEQDSSIAVRQQTVYYWHKGLPPQDGNEYRVLMCWDDKYYMHVDSKFLTFISRKGGSNYYPITSSYSGAGLSNSEWHGKAANGCPEGKYHIEVGYPTNEAGLLSDLDFDYNVLKSTGSAVSFTMPNLPVMKRLAKEEPDPLSGWTQDMLADRVQIGVIPTQEDVAGSDSTIFAADEINWMVGFRTMDYTVKKGSIVGITYDKDQKRVFSWFLYPVNSKTYNRFSDLIYGSFKNMKNGSSPSDFLNKNESATVWYVSIQDWRADGKPVFTERGFRVETGRVSDSFDDARYLRQLIGTEANIELGHSGGIFASYGNRELNTAYNVGAWHSADYETRSKFTFDIYYAEPNLMYFLKSDITVENGQTQNLDGPLVIEEGTKIIVKNGGVLSLTDWIVNQGEILIEPGGTMILQQNTTANGYTRNCAVISNNIKQTAAGRVACDGNIIIMPNCTLAAGGIYGFQFGEGAQVANYGQMVSEIWDIYTDYTIEGRNPDSYLYIGYSMNDTGFGLVPEGHHDIYGLKYLSTYQSSVYNTPINALYNGTRQRFNLQTEVHTMPLRRGRVAK